MEALDTVVSAGVVAAVGLLLSMQLRRVERDVRGEMERRFDEVDRRFDGVDGRFEQVDHRFDAIESRLDAMRSDLTSVALAVGAGPGAQAR